MKHFYQLILIFIIAISSLRAQQISLPVEVLGAEGKVVTRTFNLSAQEASSAVRLWLQVNNLSYQNKGSIKINNGAWVSLNHQTVNMQAQEKARGGMVHGGFNTIRFSIPAAGLITGSNTISFRFDLSDAISNGYRVVRFNLLDAGSNKILAADRFKEDDPATWVAPYTDATSIAQGKNLWYNGVLKSNYLPTGRKGFWYSAELKPMELMNAKCSSCHTQDGRDLEIFSYSNESIVERSKFHMLTEDEGKKIASYIRSLSSTKPNVGRWGRPWNPPYQPGPKVATMPIRQWAAGAGLDAVLDEDKDMVPYMFPNGVSQEEVYKHFDSEKSVDRTILPLAIQFPDWKHWLPMVHPMDAYNKNNYYLNESTGPNNPNKNYRELRTYLETNAPAGFPNKAELLDKIHILHNHFRFFVEQGGTVKDHWRTRDGDATKNLNDGVPREMAATSLARLFAVKNFEIVQEFEIESKAALFNPNDQVQPRQWPGDEYNVFEVPPHFQACVDNNCNQFKGQPTETGMYESTNWYQLQMVINGGDGFISHNSPVDYNYHPDFITKACNSSGVNEPMRYYHSMNVMYQTRTWSKGDSPNTGKGFRIRVMGPWNIYGITDGNQFNGFAPGEFAKTLDKVEPGMTAWVMNAMLRQFLTEVNKPHNSLSIWNRTPDGDDNSLDRADKTLADIMDAVQRTERQETFFVHYAAKMYYYIPRFQKLGVDCQIMEEVIDWCQKAWPLIDWHVFSNKGEMQLSLLLDDDKFCSGTNKITAVATNAVANTVYNWKVNGVTVSGSGNELSTNNVKAGDIVTCQITNNSTCLINKTVTSTLVMPSKGYNLTMRKVGEVDFKPLNSIVACTNDKVELKLNIVDIKPKQWLDAMDVNVGAEPANNSYITNWNDKSGNGFTAEAKQAGLQPKYKSAAMNGLPAIYFGDDNNADGLELFNINEDDFMNGDWTIMLVGKTLTNGNTDWRDMLGNKTEGANGWFYRFGGSDARVQIGIGPDLQHGKGYNFDRSFIAQITKKGDVITTYLNGISDRVITKGANVSMTINEALYLGQSSNGNPGTNRYHVGPISELMVFESAISDAQKQFLEGYLTNKWKLNNELAYTHPYSKNSPFDITLNAPNGDKYKFDAIQTGHTINLDQTNKFGSYDFIKDVCGASVESISISNCNTAPAPVVSSAGTANGTTGSAFTYTITASNTPTSYGATGLPAGLTLNTTSGVISGTPSTAGTFNATVSATNTVGTGSKAVVFTINPALFTHAIPGSIEAESYSAMFGLQTENTGDTGGGLNVGFTDANDWLDYNVNVATAGNYTVNFRVASATLGGTMQLRNSTGTVLATATIPVTGGWQTWTTVNATANLNAGTQTLRLFIVTGGFNVNWVQFVQELPIPVVSSAGTATGTTGTAFTYQITASNTPTSYGATGLPGGLTLNTTTGAITGTPTATGTFNATVSATNTGGTGSKAVTITISNPVTNTPYGGTAWAIPGTIQAENYDDGGEGVAYHDNDVINSGGQQRTTQGVDVENTGDVTGTHNVGWTGAGEWLKYTVNVSTTGTYTLLARVASPNTGKSFHVEIDGITVATVTVPTTPGWQIYQEVNVTTTIITAGNHVMRIYMDTDGFNLNYLTFAPISAAPVISSAATASGTTGTAFTYSITASNTPTSYGATGLPAGLSVNTTSGVISGIPTTAGTFNATVSATNAGGTGSKAVTITIAQAVIAPVVSSVGTASGTTGTGFTYNITASNTPISFGATGLPAGLSVNTTSGVISGIPTTAGTFNATVSATNAGGTGSKAVTITIAQAVIAPVVSSVGTASGTTGSGFTYNIIASNTPTSYGATGLPAGLSVNTSTGVISGTPTASGTFNATVSASNAGGTGSKAVTITIAQAVIAPVVSSAGTASGTVGTAFTYSIIASNTPTSYGATGLPTGITVNTTTGVISGTPTAAGTFNATVSATNAGGTGSKVVTITISNTVTNTPYLGTAWVIPGTIQAENYDDGGEGVAYHDNEVTNFGGQQRTNQGVDIENTGDVSGGTYNVGWTGAGEWMKYSVNVTTTGTYTLQARVASPNTGKSFRVEMDGITIATVSIPNTTGWQTYQTVPVTTSSITTGSHIMRIYSETDGFNLNYVSFVSNIATKPDITSATTANATLGANFTYNITASNTPTSYSATGLPAGLSVNTSTGVISGTALYSGTSNVTITATNATGTGSATLALTVSPATDAAGVITCYKAPAAITVNGSLSEAGWNVTRQFSKAVFGTANNTSTFGVMWDNANLYVGVKVLDANLYSDSPEWWEDDAIEVYIDANYNRLSTYDGFDNQIIKGYNKTGISTKLNITGLQHAIVAISGGYALELAIPWSQLGISAPAPGTTLGFDIGYNDDDNGSVREGQAMWNGTVDNWQNTSGFGRLVLNAGFATRETNVDMIAAAENNVTIYPNPVTGSFLNAVVPESWTGDAQVLISNPTGVVVQSTTGFITNHQCQINVQSLGSGIYFLQLSNGGNVVIEKFVKE
jgi:hypothetical protein